MNVYTFLQILGNVAPWLIGAIAAACVTQFLKGLGTWETVVPWQIRAFTRMLVLLVFIYMLVSAAIAFLPDGGEKIKIFSNNLDLIGDLLKTMMGAVIGALSMSLKTVAPGDEDGDGKVDNHVPPAVDPTPEPPLNPRPAPLKKPSGT